NFRNRFEPVICRLLCGSPGVFMDTVTKMPRDGEVSEAQQQHSGLTATIPARWRDKPL
ncbi:hypothetical protein BaRGS_00008047, partial [Batillaria attramentaria]